MDMTAVSNIYYKDKSVSFLSFRNKIIFKKSNSNKFMIPGLCDKLVLILKIFENQYLLPFTSLC